MRFTLVSATAVLAFSSSAVAQFFDSITSPTRDQVLPAGVPFDIIWVPDGVTGTIKITLLEGPTNITLVPGPVIKSGINNLDGKYTWTPTDDGFATYGFFLEHEQNKTLTEYSQPFHIKGSGYSSSSIEGSSTTTIKLSTGPSYTSTSTVPSSTVTIVSTSTSGNSSFPTAAPSSNITLSTTLTSARNTATKTSSTPASSSSVSPNAAAANMAKGGFALIGGLVLAFAL